MAPTVRLGIERFEFSSALNSARKRLTHAGASARVPVAAAGGHKRAGYVRVNESAGVGWRVFGMRVWQPGCVCSGTGVAWAHGCAAKCGRCVGGDVRQGAEAMVSSVQPSVHVLGGLPGGHGVDVGSGFRRANIHRSGSRVGWGGSLPCAYLCVKLVETTVPVQAVAGAEVAFRAALRAKLPDGQERVLKGGCASHVAQEYGARVAVHVGGEQMEFADCGAFSRLLVDAHDILVAWPGVDQIGLRWVYVPRAPTVDDQGQSVVQVAAPLQPVVSTGEEGVSVAAG
eukprot:950826-Pleurochrysis_carterae.AAC.2